MRSALSLFGAPARNFSRQPAIPLLSMFATRDFSSSKTKRGPGYGDMEGSPEASAPRDQQQPANLRQTQGEHPGPDPVAAGKGKGGAGQNVGGGQGQYGHSPTSSHPKDPGEASAKSGGSRSKDRMEEHQAEGGSSGGDGASADGASIMAEGSKRTKENPSAGLKGGRKEEVDMHNSTMSNSSPLNKDSNGDEVDKGFWQGNAVKDNNTPSESKS